MILGRRLPGAPPLASMPGEVSGIASLERRGVIEPWHVSLFQYLEVGETRAFPEGGRIEVIEFDAWRRAGVGDVKTALRAVDLRLTKGAELSGPLCWRAVSSDEDASEPAARANSAERVILPVFYVALATIQVALMRPWIAAVFGVYGTVIWALGAWEAGEARRLGRAVVGGRIAVFGPERDAWI